MSTNTVLASAPLTTTGFHIKATGTTLGNSLIWDNGTNVGIGNTNTSYTLDVSGTGRYNGSATTMLSVISSATASGLELKNTGGTASNWIIQSDGGAVAGQAALRFYSITASAYRMSIDGSGNVGIGTNSPTAKLEITNGRVLLNNGYSYQFYNTSSVAVDTLQMFTDGNVYLDAKDSTGGNLIFRTSNSNTERMRITSGGNIEIANASSFLQWIGGSYWTFRTVTSGTEFWLYRGDTGATPLIVTSGNIVRLSSLAGNSSRTVTADASGNLSASSDSSLKQEDTNHKIEGLAEILQLKPRAYKWLSDIEIRGKDATTEIGFFANEVNAIIPSAAPKGNDDLYGFYDRAVIAALVKAVQEQNQTIQNLQEQINILATK